MGTQNDLNKMSWPAQQAGLGDKLAAIIALVNELKTDYTALRADVTDIRTKYVQHLANGAHTAAANQTGATVTADTPAALTSTAIAAADVATLT